MLEQRSQFIYTLDAADSGFRMTLEASPDEEGIDLVTIRLWAEQPAVPPVLSLKWDFPAVNVLGIWRAIDTAERGPRCSLLPNWGQMWTASSAFSAPVACLFGYSEENRHTFAVSDALNVVRYRIGVSETDSHISCLIRLFDTPTAPLQDYTVQVRVDTRAVPYHQALGEVAAWWAAQPGYTPAPVPALCRLPVYSTWYSYHQEITDAATEEQCALSVPYGCRTVIVDDGWQTSGAFEGYVHCGDWEVYPGKIRDMKAHVAAVHELGMRYVLWYAVPFIGQESRMWKRFEHQFLYLDEHSRAAVLDPRYPDVREYLIGVYETAVREWDLDGFKLDFIDRFRQPETENPDNAPGRDYLSVPEASNRLCSDIIARLRQLKPDILIEFRQTYIGPLMRKYGNMFRAGDCPNDPLGNRVRTLDLRLLSGDTAVHGDMLEWAKEESPEVAAQQLLAVLFAVPQISVRFSEIPEEHRAMLRFWLGFCDRYREVLLCGKLMPRYPAQQYPLVQAEKEGVFLNAVYAPLLAELPAGAYREYVVVNATALSTLPLQVERSGWFRVSVWNAVGDLVREEEMELKPGLISWQVPPSGVAVFTAIE